MSAGAVILILLAAGVHAGWNTAGKREDPSAAFFLVANICGLLLLAPIFVWSNKTLAAFPPQVWVLLAWTGLCQAAYFAGLAGAYRCGHMSVAYPMARSAPVVLVMLTNAALGRGHEVNAICVSGALLVIVGGFVIPLRSLREAHLRDYRNASCAYALLAAAGTAGYSLLDDAALRLLRSVQELRDAGPALVVQYYFLEGVCTSVLLATFVSLTDGVGRVTAVVRVRLRQAAIAGFGICLAYTLVLVAMTMSRNVVYVIVLRQLSIPLGALLGMTLLHEPAHRTRITGIVLMFAGAVLACAGR